MAEERRKLSEKRLIGSARDGEQACGCGEEGIMATLTVSTGRREGGCMVADALTAREGGCMVADKSLQYARLSLRATTRDSLSRSRVIFGGGRGETD
jgi:hypothetical protein